jgi:streptogramin lyase
MRSLVIIAIATMMLFTAAPGSASDIPVSDASLTAWGLPYEINRDAAGNLFVSDWQTAEVRRITPASSAYTSYTALPALNDARPDTAGDIWLTEYWSPILARINTGAVPVTMTTWDLTAYDSTRSYKLAGLAFDGSGKLWFSEWDVNPKPSSSRLLYRFDPTSNELCGYTLPGGDHSYYVLYQSPYIWLGDQVQGRIVRVHTSTLAVTYWDSSVIQQPRGLAADSSGNIWWADVGSNRLGRLNPNAATNNLTVYTLPPAAPPNLATPYMVAVREDKIWYTAQGDEVGTIGILNPLLATGSTTTQSPANTTASGTCKAMGAGTPVAVTTAPGTLGWTSHPWTDITPAGAAGWTVYRVVGAEAPYGISTDASYAWVTDLSYSKLMRATMPLGAPHVTIHIPTGTTNVELTWTAVTGATGYQIYRDVAPYFTPGATPYATTAGTTWPDTSPSSYFYVVRATDGSTISANSNRTGKFTFALTPGSQ